MTIRVALLHYADVSNFGDVLFPLLAARELTARLPSIKIDFVSATGTGPVPSIRFDAAALEAYDAVVLAGGELIHRYDSVLTAIYGRLALKPIDRPTDLVFGWSHLRGPFKAWFGLGVPRLDEKGRDSIAQAVPGMDMIVVRGSGSARRLRAAGGAPESCTVGPDIGWLFSHLVTGEESAKSRYVVAHVLPGAVPENLGLIIGPLRELEKRGFEVVLLPLSTCWDDQTVLRRIAEVSGFKLIDHRTPELTKLRILADSAFYVGQSMHGFISTLAAGHPAGLCFPVGDDKFAELLADNGLEDLRIGTWDQLPVLLDRLLTMPRERLLGIRARSAARVSGAFDTLAENVRLHAERRRVRHAITAQPSHVQH